ncbi:hypothetical protein KR038_001630, partial [Drosophila bunnanda]
CHGATQTARWPRKTVHARIVESLCALKEDDSEAPMPTFDGAGWLNGVKILKGLSDSEVDDANGRPNRSA